MPFVPGIEPAGTSAKEPVYFVVHRRGVVVTREGGGMRMLRAAEARALRAPSPAAEHFLGRLDDADVLTVASQDEIPAPFEVVGLRGLFGEVDEVLFGIAGRAVQVVDWATTHRFCGRCATPTERAPGERSMRCPACGLTAYPRIAPAIIVIIEAIFLETPSGWASTMTLMLLIAGVQFMILGVMGEYLGRAFLSANGKPQGVVRDVIRPREQVRSE